MRQVRGPVLKLAVSLVLVGVLVHRYGGDPAFRATLANLRPQAFILAELVLIAGLVLSALRWKILLGAAGVPLGLGTSIRLYLCGYFFNFFLPTTVGGDVVRALGVGKETPLPVVGGSILVERLLGFGCLLGLGLGATFALDSLATAQLTLFVAAAVFVATLLLLLFGPLPAGGGTGLVGRGLDGLRRTALEVRGYGFHPAAIGLGILLSFGWQVALVFANGILSRGLGDVAPLAFLLALVPTIQAITMVPVSFGGLGVREVSYEYFFSASGLEPTAAVALGTAFLGVAISLALKGGLVYLIFPIRPTRK